MSRRVVLAVLVLALAPAADAAQPTLAGSWRRLPAAPVASGLAPRVGVWTGSQAIVFGRAGAPGRMRNVALAYAPSSRRWRTLSPPAGPSGSYEGTTHAVWTGSRLLVWGPSTLLSYDPSTDSWRQLSGSPLAGGPPGLVAWTGREMLGWGGGCCGDSSNVGAAYDPASGRWRMLAKAPVGGQQVPSGAWTGRELVVLPGRGADGKATGGAAYDPAKDTWRRIASPPRERLGSAAVWDGRELLVVGGVGPAAGANGARTLVSVPYAYDPARDRWRTLAAMDQGRYGRTAEAAVWTGTRLLLWGGETASAGRVVLAPHGLSYDPRADRWSRLPAAPLLGRLGPAAVWTGRALLVWGGDPLVEPIPGSQGAPDYWPSIDGAAFTPRR